MLPLQIRSTSYATGGTSCMSIALLARLYIFRCYTLRPFQVAELPFPIHRQTRLEYIGVCTQIYLAESVLIRVHPWPQNMSAHL
jgi:hypothetical protein